MGFPEQSSSECNDGLMLKMISILKNEAVRYVLVGGLSALVDYLSFVFLLYGTGTSLFLATSTSYVLGFAFNFFGHALITFRVHPTFQTAVKYATSAILNYGLSLAIMFTGITIFYSPEFWKVICFGVIAVNGFLIGRLWIFRENKQD